MRFTFNGLVLATLGSLGAIFSAGSQAQTAANNEAALSLFIVQQCASLATGGRCAVGFVQAPVDANPPAQVEQTCSPGWVAHITAERGTVESGGINRGQAAVCGHGDPGQALRALLAACNAQTLGICQNANHVNVQWAMWSGTGSALKALPMNAALNLDQLPQAAQCASVVPLVESVSCPAPAAALLRNAGLR